jgi:hypothetical protein
MPTSPCECGTNPRELRGLVQIPPEKQVLLLTSAIERSWDVERLGQAVEKARPKEVEGRRGRPRLPPGIKTLGAIERRIESEPKFQDLSFVEELDEEQVERMKKVVDGMQAWCQQAEARLERRIRTVEVLSDAEADRDLGENAKKC